MASVLNTGLAPIWPISVEDYHAMAESGILRSDDRVELLEGVIVQKPLTNPPHTYSNDTSYEVLQRVMPAGWIVRAQQPVTLSASEPEPDLAVVRGMRRNYLTRHPGPRDVGLVMEIANTSFDRDRVLKKRVYAEAGIPWYWLLDLKRRTLELYSKPKGGEYTLRAVYKAHQTADVVLDSKVVGTVRVGDLLP